MTKVDTSVYFLNVYIAHRVFMYFPINFYIGVFRVGISVGNHFCFDDIYGNVRWARIGEDGLQEFLDKQLYSTLRL